MVDVAQDSAGVVFGQRLRGIRRERGLSQQALADRLSVSKMTICDWEAGRSHPRLGRMTDVATALQCSFRDLLGDPAPAEAVGCDA